jgi:hypothetical protein
MKKTKKKKKSEKEITGRSKRMRKSLSERKEKKI